MGDTWLIVLPTDPLAVPKEPRREATFKLLQTLISRADNFEMRVSNEPEFIDCGENFETVFCPFCGTEIQEWWMEQMGRWWESVDKSLVVVAPCCNRQTSLNDLDYVHPQGFTCFAIEIMNPRGDLEPDEVAKVEASLGVTARLIWRHI